MGELQIAENYKLEELSKYGFKNFENYWYLSMETNGFTTDCEIGVYEEERILHINAETEIDTTDLGIIYTLIKDGVLTFYDIEKTKRKKELKQEIDKLNNKLEKLKKELDKI